MPDILVPRYGEVFRMLFDHIGGGDSYRKLKSATGIVITDFKWIGGSYIFSRKGVNVEDIKDMG
jgi:hypothetical protein